MPHNIVMVDASPWGLFWKRIGDGTFSTDVFKFYIDDIPKDITKIKEYAKLMLSLPADDGLFENSVYKFLILQACSFGSTAIWIENNEWRKVGGLRDYWLPTETSNRKSPVNPMMPMPESLFRRVEDIAYVFDGVVGIHDRVENVSIQKNNSVIYIDPPYKNTQHYGFEFDYINFIEKHKGFKFYVSEGVKLTDQSYLISKKRDKGGINGKSKKANEEWLNVFNT